MKQLLFIPLVFGLWTTGAKCQSAAEQEADSLAYIAMSLMDAGEIDEAIEYLEQSKALFNKWLYDYEIGLALYLNEDFKAAQKLFKKVLRKDGTDPLQYKMLGNTYSVLGNRDKARKTYHRGLKKFPNAGNLYLELGVVERADENYNEALHYWEQGIEADPTHASNYYWAAKFFSATDERIWSLLYGEIFLNLEFNTARTEEISALLYEVYNDIHEATSDTSGTFNLTEAGFTITISENDLDNLDDLDKMERMFAIPFEGEYALTIAPGAVLYDASGISLEGLHQLRTNFIDFWMDEERNKQEKYPFVLFPFHSKLMEQGLFTYYNYFLMRYGNMIEFEAFFEQNELGFQRFFDWYNQHDLLFEDRIHSRLQL